MLRVCGVSFTSLAFSSKDTFGWVGGWLTMVEIDRLFYCLEVSFT